MGVSGGFGAVLKITVTAQLTAVVHVVDFEFPEFEKVLAEITAHDSAGGYAEYVATGKKKLNEFKCKITWDKSESTHAAIQSAFDSLDPVAMEVSSPDGSENIHFDGLVSKMGRTSEQEDAYFCEVTIQPTGQPTFESV